MNYSNKSNLLLSKLEDVGAILKQNKVRKIFLVTGHKSFEVSGAKKKINELFCQYQVCVFNDFHTNPKVEDLVKGTIAFNTSCPDIIMAIGGGSVIDMAKLISCFPTNINEILKVISGIERVNNRTHKFIAVPTTAGSGSECTHFATIYHDEKKYSFSHESLLPDYIILDYKLTSGMTPYLTAVTGMDALSQAIESFWANGATNESKRFATRALKNILKVFPSVVNDSNNFKRSTMMQGAHYSGKAINISKTTAPHAVSYILTSLYNLPHGHAVALTLPSFFEYNLDEKIPENKGLNCESLSTSRRELLKLINCNSVTEGAEKLRSIIRQAGLEIKLSNLCACNKNDIPRIVSSVNRERLSNNPRGISPNELINILKHIW